MVCNPGPERAHRRPGATPPPGLSGLEEGPGGALRGRGGGAYLDCGEAAGLTSAQTRSVTIGDLDRDGRPDLVTAGFFWVRTWHNASAGRAGLTLTLDAGPGNRGGVGTRIVRAAGGCRGRETGRLVGRSWKGSPANSNAGAPG